MSLNIFLISFEMQASWALCSTTTIPKRHPREYGTDMKMFTMPIELEYNPAARIGRVSATRLLPESFLSPHSYQLTVQGPI
jgi:hypothetical protein